MNYYKEFFENTRIEMGKKIAKKQMMLLVKRNWPRLKESIFNEYGIETWKEAELFTQRLLNETSFLFQELNKELIFLCLVIVL